MQRKVALLVSDMVVMLPVLVCFVLQIACTLVYGQIQTCQYISWCITVLLVASHLSLTCSILMVESLADSETGCWLLEQYLLDIKRRKV